MADVEVSVLGPMRLRVEGAQVKVGPRPRAVLALLVAAGGRAVPASTLIEQVWPDSPPPAVHNTLQGYVALLRRTLEPGRVARAAARTVVWDGSGYALRLAPTSVDAARFEQAATEAHAALVANRPAAAVTALDAVLPTWRGRPYEDVAEAEPLLAHAARLERVRATAVADRHAAGIALGEHSAAIAPLATLVEEHPLDERLWELLALAQYRAGRQGDALATLRTARRRLAEELGVDPGDRLRRLESDVLAQAPALDPIAGSGSIRVTGGPPPGRLPMPVDGLVGRRAELTELAALLARHRLVTLVGPGGVGKTRLALELARSAPPGSTGPWLVELAPVRDPALVAATVARAVGLVGVESLDTLAAVLHGWETLLVLDNCEHLTEEIGRVVTTLLGGCPGVRVLVTGQQPLRLTGEVLAEVGPLPLPEAVELFVTRARAARPGWQVDEADGRLIRRICAAVDGLPLAVEIAAARSRVLPLDVLARSLTDRSPLLADERPGPARHRSVATAIAWGYDLLEPAEQRLLRTASVFSGGFTLDAVADLAGRLDAGSGLAGRLDAGSDDLHPPDARPAADPAGTVLRIGNLTDRSLVVRGPDDRYRMLEPIRAFAERAQDPAERAGARQAHLCWMRDLAETAEAGMVDGRAAWWTARMGPERDNVRTAFATARKAGDTVTGLRLVGALIWFWYRWGAIDEGGALLGELLDEAERRGDVDPRLTARALLARAGLRYLAGDIPSAYALMSAAVAHAERAGDQVTRARCAGYAAHFAVLVGEDPQSALDRATAAMRLAEKTGLDWVGAEVGTSLGLVVLLTRGAEAAAGPLADAWRTAVACGHDFATSNAAWSLMLAELARDRAGTAAGLGAAALVQRQDAGDVTSWMMVAHTTAGALARLAGTDAAPGGRDPAIDGATVLGALDAMSATLGFTPERTDPVHAPQVRAALAAAAGPERFAAALRAGRELDPGQVTDLLAAYLR
ncbi:BTAD domain-containing putative transcriptional regulator [Micromonospora sp. FIMYZ51]|uniref:BTAD domain-containing putative transcriptional regulator n=1 Tax=Micromonospora sp. FIMYZ51 TaxID=3051832 RepID=UPI00311EB58D